MNEKEIFYKAEEWLKDGLEISIITVIDTWGSSPRPIGSSMVVNSKNDILGSVSGGCIESFVFAKSLEVINMIQEKLLISKVMVMALIIKEITLFFTNI